MRASSTRADAARAALAFRERFRTLREEKPESLGKIDLRIGISSGVVVATRRDDSPRSDIVVSGEPFEVARRLARVNQIYGSQILLGPRTFSAAGKEIVARPIDFLRSAEPARAAGSLRIARARRESERGGTRAPRPFLDRDRLFSRTALERSLRGIQPGARRNGEQDEPLQWYLRRLEPLCLQHDDRARAGRGTARAALRRTEYPAAIRELIAQLRQMPGIGPRSAERIALWIVQARGEQPEGIASAITHTRGAIRPCVQCGFFRHRGALRESAPTIRGRGNLLCVVEQPTDILPLEKTSAFRGRYHSLGGRISPLDRVAPEDLRIASLLERVEKESPNEVIFALAADVEGEATTNYLVELLKKYPVTLTRIAHGLPAGGGLESADELTLYRALSGRTGRSRWWAGMQ